MTDASFDYTTRILWPAETEFMVPSADALLLDGISSLGPVYSMRRLLTAYAGNCIRIRRSSDNAEQDFGFVSNVVDTAGIATFISGGSGFIVTWYDQNGNVVDVTQSTAGNQPQYIASGMNSRPVARFDSSRTDHLSGGSIVFSNIANSNEATFLSALSPTNPGSGTLFYWGAAVSPRYNCHPDAGGTFAFDFGTFTNGRLSASATTSAPHVYSGYRATDGAQDLSVDGASVASGTKSDGLSGTESFLVGTYVSFSFSFQGDIAELIFTKNFTGTANINTIGKNGVGSGAGQQSMGTYYGVTMA